MHILLHETIFEDYKQVAEFSERNKAVFILVYQIKHLKVFIKIVFLF